jgi:hypothetical protein
MREIETPDDHAPRATRKERLLTALEGLRSGSTLVALAAAADLLVEVERIVRDEDAGGVH